jgi:hypothetical protein
MSNRKDPYVNCRIVDWFRKFHQKKYSEKNRKEKNGIKPERSGRKNKGT